MRSTWVCQHLWEGPRSKALSISRKGFGKKLQGWKEKLLSQAGSEVLIKVVNQAISTYTMSCFKLPKGLTMSCFKLPKGLTMSCFKLPKGLIKELEVMIRKFWWGYSGGSRKTHWVKWDRLYEAKEVGGMGFKEIEKFNDALLAKQVWRLINNPTLLCYWVFKVRFFSNCSILEARESVVGSYAWKSLLSARDVIHKGMIW